MTLDYLELRRIDNSRHLGQSSALTLNEDVTVHSVISDGFVVLDWDSYYSSCTGNDGTDSPSGGYRYWVRAYFDGSCSSESNIPKMFMEGELDYCSPALLDETIRLDAVKNNPTQIVIPDLSVSSPAFNNTFQAYNDLATWGITVRENNGAPATNAWMVFVSQSGIIVPAALRRSNGTTITPINNVYPLGTMSGFSNTAFTLDADYEECYDSLTVLVGWDCDAIPTSDQQAIQGGLSCSSTSTTLYLETEGGSLQQEFLQQPDTLIPCTPVTYEIEVTNVGIGTIYEPVVELFLPYTDAMQIIEGSELGCYPCDVSSPNYSHALGVPTDIIILPQGIKYIWELDQLISSFDWNDGTNPQGWEGFPFSLSPFDPIRKLRLRFDVDVSCDFIGGDFIRLISKGHTYCQDEVLTLLQAGKQIDLEGSSKPYNSTMNLSIAGEPLNGCDNGATVDLSGDFIFTGMTDGQDSLVIALPPAWSFESVTFNPAYLSNATPKITTFGPVGPIGGGTSTFQELKWAINPNIPAFTSIPFSLQVTQDTSGILCEDDNLIFMRTVRSSTSYCGTPANVCNAQIMTGAKNTLIDLTSMIVAASCDFATLNIEELTIRNTGSIPVINQVSIDFYYDADNSDDYSVGDILIGNGVHLTGIPVGTEVAMSAGPFLLADPTWSCKIIAVANSCSCGTPEIRANALKTANAGDNPIGCSSDILSLGCGTDLSAQGFSYEWFGLDGAPVDSLVDNFDPNTNLNYTHFDAVDKTLQYVLLTISPSGVCTSVDTVSATFKGLESETGDLIKACMGGQVQLTGPTGFYDYQWTPTTGLVDPNDPLTLASAPVGIQTYTLTYRDLEDCKIAYFQSVQGVNCTDLELFKTVSTSMANIGEVLTYDLTLINQGPNGASFVEVTDALPVGLSYLSTLPDDGNYDPVSGLWTIPGVILPGDTLTRKIYAQITGIGGAIFNVAEITDMAEGDLDSTPGNDDETEDDQQGVCTAVPVSLLCREQKTIQIPDEFSSYQWFKDGIAITDATTYMITVAESGTYQVEVDGGSCPYGNCCPFVVVEEPCANLGNFVWEDLNNDGLQDGTETGIEFLTVTLYDANSGLPVDTVITDNNGAYLFEEIPSGDYYVEFDISTNTTGIEYVATTQFASGNTLLDSDVNSGTNETNVFNFNAANGDDLTIDAGFVPQADLGNFVWVDTDMDGLQDIFGEPGVEQVSVTLYDANTGLSIATTTTDTNGFYLFENLPFGDYFLGFNLNSAVGYEDYGFTEAGAGNSADDSEVDFDGTTASFSFDPRTGNDLTHDAGIIPPTDLAINKMVNNINPAIGEVIIFTITVVNESLIGATGIEVTEQLPSGFAYVNDNSGGAYNNSTGIWMIGDLAGGNSASLTIAATVLPGGIYINETEISAMNGADIDSNPSTGSTVDDKGDGLPDDDEDRIVIQPGATFDLSLEKVLATGQANAVDLGDDVTYTIIIDNEGDIAATNIAIVDRIPAGTMLSPNDTNAWTSINDSTATVTIPGPIAAGGSASINIVLKVIYGASNASLANTAEITETFDENGNPVTDTDSEVDNGNPNEDDIDDAVVMLLEHDPTGYIYCDKTGFIVTGGTISVTGPNGIPNSEVVIIQDGVTGAYEFFEVGPAGIYTITYTHPDGISLSTTRLPLAGPYDVTSGPDPTVFGSDASNGYLDDETAVGNPYYLSFEVEQGDPYIELNNLPVGCVFIGDTVCEDVDANNTNDGTEPGMANVTVRLFDCSDTTTVLRETTTSGNGNYGFDGLLAGDYQVQFLTPAGYAPINGNNLDQNGFAPCVSLAFGECDTTTSVCFTLLADLGNFVWVDSDGDGIQDIGEAGIPNVEVILFDFTTGLPIDTVYTDINGNYLFENIPGGEYYVSFNPDGSGIGNYEFTNQGVGNTVSDSDAGSNGQTTNFNFDPYNGNKLDIDAGVVPVAEIGNFVWVDADGDGIQDAGETGVENVMVVLYDANTGLALDTVFTDGLGAYSFTNIPTGDYYLGFDPSTNVSGIDYPFTTAGTGNGINDNEADNNGFTPSFSFDPTTGNDLTHDAGLVPVADIGNYVFIDNNDDGLQDGMDTPVENVMVILYDSNTGLALDTVFTDSNGEYLFTDIPSGEYYIDFNTITSVTPGASDFPFVEAGQGNGTNDSEADSNGITPSFTFDATSGDDLDHAAGLSPVADIGDYVWIDTDGDGLQDDGESGIQNVSVILYDANTDTPLDTVLTDASGAYVFADQSAGDYYLIYDLSTAGGAANYLFTSTNQGTGANDSEANASGRGTDFNFNPSNGNDLTHDAGVVPVAEIGNFVWVDADGDGIQDTGEMGVENVRVILYDVNTGLALDTVFTDGSGAYRFTNVPEGDYYIGFDPTTSTVSGDNFLFTNANAGNGANDSDVSSAGFTNSFNFDPTTGNDLTIDAGIVPSADLGNFVWIDTNGDGIQDGGETGIQGVTVILYDSNTGLPVDTVLTDSNGGYLFADIPSGDYYLDFDATTSVLGDNFSFTQTNTTTDDLDSDVNAAGLTNTFSFDAFAGDKLTCDAGLLPTPEIRTIKQVLSVNTLPSGNVAITFELGVKNTGPVDLTNLSLTDDLTTQLGSAFPTAGAPSPVVSIVASTAANTPTLNATFNGTGDNDIFAGAATDLLEPGQEIKINLTIEIDPNAAVYPLSNQTIATGEGLDDNGNPLEDGTGNPIVVIDNSDGGSDYEGTNPSDPGDQGTSDDPTLIDCVPANIIITGEPNTGICPDESVTLSVTSAVVGANYEWRVLGNPTVIATNAMPTFMNIQTTTSYEVTIINTSTNCYFDLLDTTTIIVNPSPATAPAASYTLNPDCSASDLSLSANASSGLSPYTYSWT
ncbi:MAG: SdrD B-like domain-containing protein, partial [Saprospiraceae bacterium]